MTAAELIAELETLLATSADPEGYLTVDEYGELMGLGRVAVQKRLKVAHNAGRLECVRVKRQAIDGRMMHTPAYRILPEHAGRPTN